MADLDDHPIRIERTIAWGEMDAFQHVNNVHYFRFFEDARIAYFREMGVYDPTADEAFDRVGPILAATSCEFRSPLTYPDEIVVGARATDVGDNRFTLVYTVVNDTADRIAAVGDSVVVSYDYLEQCKAELPDAWRDAIRRLESEAS